MPPEEIRQRVRSTRTRLTLDEIAVAIFICEDGLSGIVEISLDLVAYVAQPGPQLRAKALAVGRQGRFSKCPGKLSYIANHWFSTSFPQTLLCRRCQGEKVVLGH